MVTIPEVRGHPGVGQDDDKDEDVDDEGVEGDVPMDGHRRLAGTVEASEAERRQEHHRQRHAGADAEDDRVRLEEKRR